MLGNWMCGPNSILLREKLGVGISLLILWCHAKSGVSDESEFQCFLSVSDWVFSHSTNVQESPS